MKKEKVIRSFRIHPAIPIFLILILGITGFTLLQVLGQVEDEIVARFLQSFIIILIASAFGLIILEWYFTVLYITNRRVIYRKGFTWKRFLSFPYQQIQDVKYYKGIPGKLFGFGNVIIETAGREHGKILAPFINFPELAVSLISQYITRQTPLFEYFPNK